MPSCSRLTGTVAKAYRRLEADGVKAKPYHAGLTTRERTTHQELFLQDEARVICATRIIRSQS